MSSSAEDGFREIQLNGKQLVFLFMAVTVASVVIFLLGVLVGRGARVERATSEVAVVDDMPPADVPATGAISAPALPGSDPTRAAPPPIVDDLSYYNRLERDQQGPEKLKSAPREPVQRAAAATPAAQSAPPTSVVAPPAPKERDAAGRTFVVQIAALNERGEADVMAKRIGAKGYQAYVQAPASGAPNIYRVRIGPFKTRREADSTASRIAKEEQLKPWVTNP